MSVKYVDSNVFIYPVLYTDAKAKRCGRILQDIISQEFQAVTSALTWDEFTYVVMRTLGRKTAAEQSGKLLAFPHLLFMEVDTKVLQEAHRLINTHNLRPRDAIHLATALLHKADCVISDDSDFDKAGIIHRQPA